MWESLLLLLPARVTEKEIVFHREFVVHSYEKFYENLCGTGYRDREELTRIKKRVAYSMATLRWYDHKFYRAYRRFCKRAWHLPVKGFIKNPAKVPKACPIPYLVIDGSTISPNPECG